jgi:hypothetical protein
LHVAIKQSFAGFRMAFGYNQGTKKKKTPAEPRGNKNNIFLN